MTWQFGTIARVTAVLEDNDGSVINNVFNLVRGAPVISNAEAVEAVGEWLEDIYTELNSTISEEVSYVGFNVLLIASDEPLNGNLWPTLTIGGEIGHQMPPGVCGLSSFTTGFSKHVGRKYWPPFSVNGLVDGNWSGAYVTAMNTGAAIARAAFTATNGAQFTPVVVDAITGVGRFILANITTDIPAYQRRRRQGVGV